MQGFFVATLRLEAMVTGELQAIRVELKYCEACGTLWLRPQSSTARYCRRCEKVMAELSRAGRTAPAEEERA